MKTNAAKSLLKRTLKYPAYRLINRLKLGLLKGEVLEIEINAKVGFFAQLNWCLYILAYCEQYELTPRISLVGPLYAAEPGDNWFKYFFTSSEAHRTVGDKDRGCLRINSIEETGFSREYEPSMTIEQGNYLIQKYFLIDDEIRSYVDRFVDAEFSKSGTIGLHYRGTDKVSEAASVSWDQCLRSVSKLSEDYPEYKSLFVSSDDANFVEWISARMSGKLNVFYHEDSERSRGNQAIHTSSSGDNYKKGFEALVNCILLSRCDVLVRTASFLSAWSSILNPNLPLTLLNEPYTHTCWFPDRELAKISNDKYRDV